MLIHTIILLRITNAVRSAHGDFFATKRACARFCTEALVDAAELGLASLTTAEIAKFASTVTDRKPTNPGGDWAIEALCSWMHAINMREWSEAFERSCVAARAEFPAAYAELGTAL